MRAALEFLDPRKRALARAKLRAWWEGEPFDAETFQASLDAEPAANDDNDPADVELELFDAPADPRLDALQRLWGPGRLMPTADEDGIRELLAGGGEASVALLGPGLAGPVAAFQSAGGLTVFEWRAETRAALADGLKQAASKAAVETLDHDVTTLAAATFDGLVSFDDFTFAGNPLRLALQIARTLKPGAKAVIETYAALPGTPLGAAFASAFAEPQMHADGVLAHAFTEAGLDIDADENITAAHVAAARAAFQRFTESMSSQPALPPGEARELAWETQTWRARLKVLAQGALQRRRFVVHRRV